MKKPWLAALLNTIPGVGYLYLRTKTPFALMLLASQIPGIILSFDPTMVAYGSYIASLPLAWFCIGLSIAAFIWDGYTEAKRINSTKKS